MIKVISENEGISKEIFEFVRMCFPSYEREKEINIKIDFINKIIYFKSDFYNGPFTYEETSYKVKFEIKKAIFKNLYMFFERISKWGILTGVKPTKFMINLVEKHKDINLVKNILSNDYFLSDDAINLLEEIISVEEKIIYPENKNNYSIYIHIPFCPTKCSYCSFQTYTNQEYLDKYIDTLINEINLTKDYFSKSPVSIYIGGGTPTSIGLKALEKVISCVSEYGTAKEFTVECGRVDTIDDEILSMLSENKVNRVSINPQSFVQKTLFSLNRTTLIDEFYEKYNLVKSKNFNSINMDLIMGLPNESNDDMLYSLKSALDLKPENITIHTLAIKNGSELFNQDLINDLELENVLRTTKNILKDNHYKPYYMYRQKRISGDGENIGYALNNKESIYNILMMEEKQTIIGFGLSSSTKIYYPELKDTKLIMNYRNLNDYINKELSRLNNKFNYYRQFNF